MPSMARLKRCSRKYFFQAAMRISYFHFWWPQENLDCSMPPWHPRAHALQLQGGRGEQPHAGYGVLAYQAQQCILQHAVRQDLLRRYQRWLAALKQVLSPQSMSGHLLLANCASLVLSLGASSDLPHRSQKKANRLRSCWGRQFFCAHGKL